MAAYTKSYDELTIADNFLFQKVMRNKRICKKLLEKILKTTIRDIRYPEQEKSISINYDSKGVRLDVYVEDSEGVIYDVEMQCAVGATGELPKRARYYQAMIDMESLDKGADYTELKKTFIIFICTFDLFGEGLPVYTFSHRCEELGKVALGDEATKLFLNSKFSVEPEDTDIAAFLRYVDGRMAEGEFTQEIAREAERVKEHKETRREYMTFQMEIERQRRDAAQKERESGIKSALAMLKSLAANKETAIRQLIQFYHMTPNDAKACVEANW